MGGSIRARQFTEGFLWKIHFEDPPPPDRPKADKWADRWMVPLVSLLLVQHVLYLKCRSLSMLRQSFVDLRVENPNKVLDKGDVLSIRASSCSLYLFNLSLIVNPE